MQDLHLSKPQIKTSKIFRGVSCISLLWPPCNIFTVFQVKKKSTVRLETHNLILISVPPSKHMDLIQNLHLHCTYCILYLQVYKERGRDNFGIILWQFQYKLPSQQLCIYRSPMKIIALRDKCVQNLSAVQFVWNCKQHHFSSRYPLLADR